MRESSAGTIRDYQIALDVLTSGDTTRLDELALSLEGFPDGVDPHLGRRWILHAIDVGPQTSIEWMLARGVDLAFRDEEGYTPLLVAIESRRSDRCDVMERLLRAGAPVNLKGINDWTPAHMAAARDDVDGLRVLVAHGADLSIRTDIDDRATPLEEARNLGKRNAAEFLEGLV
jgi:ankyrin repeat protein